MNADDFNISPLGTYSVTQEVLNPDTPQFTTVRVTVKKVSGGATVLTTEVPGPGNVNQPGTRDER